MKIIFIILFCIYNTSQSVDRIEEQIISNNLQKHILIEPEKNYLTFETERLIGCPASLEFIKASADLLNQKKDNTINGRYYENGQIKDEMWINHKNKLIIGDLENGLINCRFFFLKSNPGKLVCFIGGELELLENNQRGDKIILYWGTDMEYQGQGLTTEALKGFLVSDLLRDPYCTHVVASIHPDNKASIHLSEKILKTQKTREGLNFAKTQPRHFYETPYSALSQIIKQYAPIQYIK